MTLLRAVLHLRRSRELDRLRREQRIGEQEARLTLYSTSKRRVIGAPKKAPGVSEAPRAR